jgi:nucleoside-triphosphatase
MSPRIFVTGPPGCGKTTVIRRVAEILGEKAAGFYTEEIRDARRRRVGFRVVTLDGRRGELADKWSGRGPRVGSYRVNVGSFEHVALPSLDVEEGRILIVDEIGKMECCSEAFVRRVRELLQTGPPVLATIPLRGGGDFLEEVRRKGDVKTFTVTLENRETLPAQIAAMLSALPTQGAGPQNRCLPENPWRPGVR